MYLVSRYGGSGRNLWIHVTDGTINIRSEDEDLHAVIKDGEIYEQTRRMEHGHTTLRYGEFCKTRKPGKALSEEFFQRGTLRAIRRGSLWKRETGLSLCGHKGTLECFSTSGGAFGKEVFRYNNGTIAYIASRWRKKLLIRRPNGRPWIVIEGKVTLGRCSIVEDLNESEDELGMWHFLRGQNWNVTIYYNDGVRIDTQGHVENRQKQGKWLEGGRTFYYLSGVRVSKTLHEESPDKWDAYEVLKIKNAQVRCSLLNRMGYDKLLEKVKYKVIDEGDNGQQLLQVNTAVSEDSYEDTDRILKLLKVICPSTGQVYVLRVPPDFTKCEPARQWTLGLQEDGISKGAQLELVRET
jgi:hypothetical protein